MELAKSKCLITGISGFLGENLATFLAPKVSSIIGFYSSTYPVKLDKFSNIQLVKVQLDDLDSIRKHTQGIDFIFHLAAVAKLWTKNPNTPHHVNVIGTKNILQAAIESRCRKVIYTSTAATFGHSSDGKPVDESCGISTEIFTEYEKTKIEALAVCDEFIQKGLHICIASPTRIFGAGRLSQSNAVSKMLMNYASNPFGFLPGNGLQMGNYVHVDDVVEALFLILKKGVSGENYILGAYNLSLKELFDSWGNFSGKKKKLVGIPIFLLVSFAKANDIYTKLLKRAPIITTPWLKRYLRNWVFSNQKAVQNLDWKPQILNEAFVKLKDNS